MAEVPVAAQSLNAKLNGIVNFNMLGTKIYRVSEQQNLAKLKYQLTPNAIGLGVFHTDLESPYQQLKLQYLNEYLGRCSDSLETLCGVVAAIGGELEKFYFPRSQMPGAQMVESMLTDGAFVLELFHKYETLLNSDGAYQGIYKWIPGRVMKTIRKDLLKFENQIPFSVIKRLYCMQNGESDESIRKLITTCMKFFGVDVPGLNLPGLEPEHLLSLYYRLHGPRPRAEVPPNHAINVGENVGSGENQGTGGERRPISKPKVTVPTASNLKESAVQFRRSAEHNYVRFVKQKLELPPLVFDDFKRCALTNFVIYEGVRGGKKPVSSLCLFLNSLLRTDKDVDILCKKGIIENTSGNDKEIVDFFSDVCTDVEVSSDEYLSDVIDRVHVHFSSKIKRWGAVLKREHFRWPWSVAVFVWAIILAATNIAGFIFNLQRHLRN